MYESGQHYGARKPGSVWQEAQDHPQVSFRPSHVLPERKNSMSRTSTQSNGCGERLPGHTALVCVHMYIHLCMLGVFRCA